MGDSTVRVKKTAAVVTDGPKLGVLYLRVSSKQQLGGDYDPLGQSIPTQRKECESASATHGIKLVKEFIDPGRSATTTERRVAFDDVMAYVRAHRDIRFIVVYNRARLFRNEYDAAIAKRELDLLGVRIISVLDYTDDSLTGQMVAGVLDVVNAYQVRAQGADISLKMAGKVERGGSIARAQLGYLNVRDTTDDGRELRTIAVDLERHRLVHLAFELYATGVYGYDAVLEMVTDAGLRTRPTRKFPAGKPLSRHKLEQMLKDRFYIGEVTLKGVWYPGRHTPIIERDLFDRVQDVRAERGGGDGTRQRRHHHYLKGTAFCPRCKSRYLYVPGKSKSGVSYFYFVCALKHHGNQCPMPYLRQADAERAVEDHYASLAVPASLREEIERRMADAVGTTNATDGKLREQLTRQVADYETRIDALLDLVGNPKWPTEKLTAKMDALREEQGRVARKLEALNGPDLDAGREAVSKLLALLDRPQDLYRGASDSTRRVLNEVFFTRVCLDWQDGADTPRVTGDQVTDYLSPFVEVQRARTGAKTTNGAVSEDNAASVTPATLLAAALDGQCSNKVAMVDLRGFEPLTPSMRTRCATGLRYRPIPLRGRW